MKKYVLIAIASLSLFGCSKNDDEQKDNCKTCEDITIFLATVDVEVCDNGDGTADINYSVNGQSVPTQTIDLEGESISDYSCSDLEEINFDF